MKRSTMYVLMCAFLLLFASAAWAGDTIPKAAWKRPLGLPLSNPGVTRVAGDIDDGYWQGVPVGGFGAGTFSRSYRGNFERWHRAYFRGVASSLGLGFHDASDRNRK